MDSRELRDLFISWLVLGLAFGNLLGGLEPRPVAISLLTVGAGFLLHELSHRVVARRFGLGAEFHADYQMLGLAFVLSFAGFIFAAPGAVYTLGNRTGRQQMLISAAGPITNIVLALLFLGFQGDVGLYGFRINSWLALFNMLPAAGLDGQSVYRYDKIVFFGIVAIAGFLVFLV